MKPSLHVINIYSMWKAVWCVIMRTVLAALVFTVREQLYSRCFFRLDVESCVAESYFAGKLALHCDFTALFNFIGKIVFEFTLQKHIAWFSESYSLSATLQVADWTGCTHLFFKNQHQNQQLPHGLKIPKQYTLMLNEINGIHQWQTLNEIND